MQHCCYFMAYLRCGVDAVNHAQSARAFEIRTAKHAFESWQGQYRLAKEHLNKYQAPVSRSTAWWIFNVSRNNYLKSMAQLRSALKTPKGE